MILLEPCDLDDLDSAQALAAVAADIHAHQATPDAAGFFTATRHTSLLAALLVALHGDALHRLDQDSTAERLRTGPLADSASQVATALAHYSRAAVPLAALAVFPTVTLTDRMTGVEQYSAVIGEIHAARQALDQAGTVLNHPESPAAAPGPSAHPTTGHPTPKPTATTDRHRLTEPQKAALRTIAAGSVKIYDSGRSGSLRIFADSGARITLRTYERLRSLGLVGRDTTTGLYGGQKLYATDTGRAALTTLTATAKTPVPAPRPAPRRR